jgi:Ni/Co efflux regulator RcnB
VTNDIDVIESRRERAAERAERAPELQAQNAPASQQEQRQVFQQRAPRDFGNGPRGDREVSAERGNSDGSNIARRFLERRSSQQQSTQQNNVDVRRDNRGFDNRRGGGFNRVPPPSEVVGTPQNSQQNDGRRFEQRDGQRFGRNEEYRSDRDESRRFDRDDYRRRGEIARDKNWYRDDSGKWQRRDGRNYGHRDNHDYGYNSGAKDFRWNRDWRRDSRYDWQRYRFSNRNSFRQSRYYDPFGSRYGYQRFSIGIRIGSSYYSDRYWISDPFAYRLPYADGPYRWVRYYDDVLLIDLRNGGVVDVIHDFFW